MVLYRKRSGQSILEYALLLGVIAAGILIMQSFVKRGFQGRLKDSADRISGGEAFSAGGTTVFQKRDLTTDQEITEETATTTTGGISNYVSGLEGTADKGVYSLNRREGGDATSETKARTEAAKQEKYQWDEYQDDTVDDFEFEEGSFDLGS